MNFEMFYFLYILIPLFSFTTQTLVKWLPDSSFNLPINFKNGELPCSKQTVIFPARLVGSVKINSETNVNSFVLPIDGEMVLEGTINLGEDPYETNCTEGNVYYLENSKASWAQANVWSSSKFNKATPDAERVPCFDDIVEFPANIQTTVTLPELLQHVRYIQVGDRQFTSTTKFHDHVITGSDEPIQFILNTLYGVGLVIGDTQCQSRSGCPCQDNFLQIDCSSKYCPVPTCVHPIKPIGHCCKICGGYISFDITKSFDMMEFKELVEKIVESYGRDNLEYHIGRLPNDKVQLVIVDKDEYDGTSAEVLHTIDYNIKEHWVEGTKYALISGSPLSKAGLGGKIFISVFFLVVCTMGMIYVYYYKVPEIRYPMLGRSLPTFLARIQRRSDSVVSLTRRDSVMTSTRRTAFRNPLYDSKRGRVQVDEEVTSQ
ncbi:PREDICTED: protein amnionless [Papilio xuthus]|uniref:Protein amnionless n=1 Tax=Papilio xuthus TaxID=66420 RepID=A0AAJ6ZRC2_PAPXU|nr:PREDICTED: protein amnionless [Papilio xuthus]